MPTQNPRINVVLDDLLYQNVRVLAEMENVSLSAKARDLLKDAFEIQEDIALSQFAENREKSWDESESLTHNDMWARARAKVMPYRLRYHPEVKRTELSRIDPKDRKVIKEAIEKRLVTKPETYGRPLQRTLKGYWKMRVVEYRVLFKAFGGTIQVLGIPHWSCNSDVPGVRGRVASRAIATSRAICAC